MALPAPKDHYTFADCLTWGENERIEIINGEAVMMAPPTRIHQEISGELFRQLANFLEGKKCKVYAVVRCYLVDYGPVNKARGALSLGLCVGLDGAAPLRGHSDLDLDKLLHVLTVCSLLGLCLFSHVDLLSGEPPKLGAPPSSCLYYTTKINVRPYTYYPKIRPYICGVYQLMCTTIYDIIHTVKRDRAPGARHAVEIDETAAVPGPTYHLRHEP